MLVFAGEKNKPHLWTSSSPKFQATQCHVSGLQEFDLTLWQQRCRGTDDTLWITTQNWYGNITSEACDEIYKQRGLEFKVQSQFHPMSDDCVEQADCGSDHLGENARHVGRWGHSRKALLPPTLTRSSPTIESAYMCSHLLLDGAGSRPLDRCPPPSPYPPTGQHLK